MQHLQQQQPHHPHFLTLHQAHAAEPSCRGHHPSMPSPEAHELLKPLIKEGLLMNTHSFSPTDTSDLLNSPPVLSPKGKLTTYTSPSADSYLTTTYRILLSPDGKLHTHVPLPSADDRLLNTHRLLAREGQLNTHISLALAEGQLRAHTPLPTESKLQMPLTAPQDTNSLQTRENELNTHRSTRKIEGHLTMQTYCNSSSTTSSENYKPIIPPSSPYYKPSEPIHTRACQAPADSNIERRILVDHLSSIEKIAQRNTIDSPAETTASTELSMMGWRRFCSPSAVNVPARVSALHRQIVMIGDPRDRDDSVHNSLSDHEVCLELNIGPSKGVAAHAGSKKTLQDIHSEERSGFSKWQRPEPDKQNADCTPKCQGNAGRTCRPESLNVGPCVSAPASPLRFCLGSSNPNTILVSTTSSSDCIDPAISTDVKSKNHDTPVSNCLYTQGLFNPSALMPRFLGMRSTEHTPHHHCTEDEAVLCHDDRLLPTSMLLQAAFPSEISCKRRKLDIQAHSNLTPSKYSESDTNQEGFHCQIPHNIIKTCNGTETDYMEEAKHSEIKNADKEHRDSPKLLAMIDLDHLRYHGLSTPRILRPMDTPNVQERSLIEFLHAKKQHRDHFLDKVVVKEDVYQSHPWNFTGGGRGDGVAAGSLYFCCSTKYTKRGNMTRNRMTREGGRWKQQGMVQPIYYSMSGHGSGGGGSSDVEAAHKTYLSYIPRGSCSKGRASFFVNLHNSCVASDSGGPGRLKHRHRMIEIALQEDLLLEKRSFQLKVTPKPFLVVCVLRNSSH